MSRVAASEVKLLVNTSLSDPIVQTWIDGASTVVNANAECIGSDEEVLTQVELYLSAHFVAMLDPALRGFVTKEGPPGFETTYSNPMTIKNNIDSTPYGTTANMLSNGCLASTSDRSISLCALGGG